MRIRNLTAKIASLGLAIAVWFLISDHLDSQNNLNRIEEEAPLGLAPAVNPDIQGAKEVEEVPEKPTVH
ncbi:MAG: hypothetical protein Q7Q71_16610 [Verrucomicrobiota bacterium JB023]|nr:hypothetical protein [Verrucomicrobiota bacterium JB023]